jgi:hypothetical protein
MPHRPVQKKQRVETLGETLFATESEAIITRAGPEPAWRFGQR